MAIRRASSVLQYDVEHDIATYLKGSVKELNKFHSYETEKITQ